MEAVNNWDDVRVDPDLKGGFTLITSFTYQFLSADIKCTYHAGANWNGGSIPQPLNAIVPRFGKYDPAFMVHDFNYQLGIVSRKEADIELRAMLKDLGMGIIKRNLIYRSVRLFGGGFYTNSIDR